MHVYLPPPYPEELVFSVFARHTRNTGSPTANLIRAAFGSYRHVGVGLCGNLEQLAAATSRVWGLSAESILDRHTNFPVYSGYMSEDVASQIKGQIVMGDISSPVVKMGLNSSGIVRNKYLRICPECCREDVFLYGETFWHRAHQLDGILVCHKHRLWLQATPYHLRIAPRASFPDATVAWESGNFSEACELPSSPAIHHSEIANALLESVDFRTCNFRAKNYQHRLMRRGFMTSSFRVDSRRVVDALMGRLGPSLIDEIGISAIPSGGGGFVRRVLSRSNSNFHYVYHIVLEEFLANTAEVPYPSVGFGPWRCPNPYCNQPEPRHIGKVTVSTVRTGQAARGICLCGFKFTFRDVVDGLPKVHSVKHYGSTWAGPVKKLRNDGYSLNKISKTLRISIDTVRDLLDRDQLPLVRNPDRLQSMRDEWVSLRDSLPGRSILKAMNANRGLYNRLRRADPDWMNAECSTDRAPRNQGQRPVDHNARDRSWSVQIEEAAKYVADLNPGGRLTATRILRAAGMSPRTVGSLTRSKNYPLCQEVLNRWIESKHDHWSRKLRAAVDELGGPSDSLKRWMVLRAAGIKLTGMEKGCRLEVERLLDDILQGRV